MQFTFATLVTLAVSAMAMPSPSGGKGLALSKASGYCQAGEIACCNPKKDIKADGVLGNLLAEGALNNLLGVGDSACASQSLIKNLNLLGFTQEGQEGTTCKNTIACCPSGKDCTAIDA
ncbi:hypothetical protein N7447_009194 [Penicillium robsamsonii]|uniref:uncharacterized protein n=1 Tax=Penicillium robsamsonii TaxID=1792511 RepID=UPI002547DC48|nr:uncharacterized protein N7447_009194 [Penicillium robsamsonii]KAJ5816961.1 hypothetical protein N7447_009194 [Penicillium robsamsonii]